ncbi:MAG: sulfite exporter TauE/SafE family protein [Candidatus Omnitrophica bacterium]|nr:sulfite exporter TauE/SafE family protein [Candidatus Omnitrophota bacterium]
MNPFFLILIGLVGGIIGGVFGVGGGIIVVPALVFFFGFTQHMAQGTMLATLLLPSFVFAVWTYYKAGNINIMAALLVSAGMMAGSILGARYAQHLSAPALKIMFGVLMIISGLKVIFW